MVIELIGGPLDGYHVRIGTIAVPARVRLDTQAGRVVEYAIGEEAFHFVGYVEGVAADADTTS